mgnify:CR=1 FL=1
MKMVVLPSYEYIDGIPLSNVPAYRCPKCHHLFFTEELAALSGKFPDFRYIPALSEPKNDDKWQGEVGLITAVVERYIDNAGGSEAYLCGPPPMIDASLNVLTKKGMKTENIYFDKF